MADTKTLIEQAYAAFNKRDIDGALALMTHDVSWPKASEGGKVIGREEIHILLEPLSLGSIRMRSLFCCECSPGPFALL